MPYIYCTGRYRSCLIDIVHTVAICVATAGLSVENTKVHKYGSVLLGTPFGLVNSVPMFLLFFQSQDVQK